MSKEILDKQITVQDLSMADKTHHLEKHISVNFDDYTMSNNKRNRLVKIMTKWSPEQMTDKPGLIFHINLAFKEVKVEIEGVLAAMTEAEKTTKKIF